MRILPGSRVSARISHLNDAGGGKKILSSGLWPSSLTCCTRHRTLQLEGERPRFSMRTSVDDEKSGGGRASVLIAA
ncbi:hypothetical protein F383_17925 [Gossypium arboreum]|uniref:Uncharacterized protein n=1 Tax=Gossypium arboreum TaxID=29729 RepID=A0A0B0NGG8_GOSAR|nr:hypothetical protein F383_17925 [Gossypium arboreum]